MSLCLKRKKRLFLLILIILIPVILLLSKLNCLNEFKNGTIDVAEKIVNSEYVASISDIAKLFVSGDVSAEVTDTKNLDVTLCFNPKTKRLEASLQNIAKKNSKVQAFYSRNETGISVEKSGGRFYTVENTENSNIGKVFSEFTNINPGTIVKYFVDGSAGDIVEDLSVTKKLFHNNKRKFIVKGLYLLSVSEITKSKDEKLDEDIYEVRIPSNELRTVVSDLICEQNGFGTSVVSLSKRLLTKLNEGDAVVKLRHNTGKTTALNLNIPIIHNHKDYDLNIGFSGENMIPHTSVVDKNSGKEVFSVYVYERTNATKDVLSDYRLRAVSETKNYDAEKKLLEVNFFGKKYILKKLNNGHRNEFLITETSKNKNICTISFTDRNYSELNVIQKENLYEASLDKVVEIGNSVRNVFE